MGEISKLESRATKAILLSSFALITGLAMRVGALYMQHGMALSITGKVLTWTGSATLAFALPVFTKERAKHDKHAYPMILAISAVATIAGAILAGVDMGHQAPEMVGYSFVTWGGGAFLITALNLYLDEDRAKKEDPKPETISEKAGRAAEQRAAQKS